MRPAGTQLPFVLLATFATGFGFGVVLPVSSVILEELHVATPLIGLTATAMFAGIALGSPLAGRCIELFGIRRTLATGLAVSAFSIAAMGMLFSLPMWFVLRFVMGVFFALTFISCETLINRVSTDKNRGRNLGLYGFAFSLSLMLGPAGLWLLQFGRGLPFFVAGIVSLVMAGVMYRAIPAMPETPQHYKLDFNFIRRIRLSVVAMLMAGFMEGALIALIPVYALRDGFTEMQTSVLLFFFMFGHGGFAPLMGMLGDRIGLKKVLLITYGLGAASFFVVTLMPPTMYLTAVLALGGAAVGVLYPLAVGLLADVLSAAELPRGNAMTAFCYGLGSIAGPFLPALIMHISIPKSLFAVAALLYCAVFAFTRRSLGGKA
jgi:MFS family permease